MKIIKISLIVLIFNFLASVFIYAEGKIGMRDMGSLKYHSVKTSPVLGGYYSTYADSIKDIPNELDKALLASYKGFSIIGYSDAEYGMGVRGVNIVGIGIRGYAFSQGKSGVHGFSMYGTGVSGISDKGDGVAGRSNGVDRAGVYGLSTEKKVHAAEGMNTEGGIAVYSDGDMYVKGNISAMNLKNLVSEAPSITASSAIPNCLPAKLRDNIFNRGNEGIWQADTKKETTYPWVSIYWGNAQYVNINEIKIYRIGDTSKVRVTIYRKMNDKTEFDVDLLSSTCVPKIITLTPLEGAGVTQVKITILSGTGLAEVECYYNPARWLAQPPPGGGSWQYKP